MDASTYFLLCGIALHVKLITFCRLTTSRATGVPRLTTLRASGAPHLTTLLPTGVPFLTLFHAGRCWSGGCWSDWLYLGLGI